MILLAWGSIGVSVALALYTYVFYPLILAVLRRPGEASDAGPGMDPWPTISITVPAYNEAAQIRHTIESLLRIDYPQGRRQILVVSDASTDGTDGIVEEYGDRGVELVRMPERVGKTSAENAARAWLTGEIIINTDASVRVDPSAVKALVRAFADPAVGVASSRDVSTGGAGAEANAAESGYVGYEMAVRRLESRAGGIVGASGSLYAIRRELHDYALPPGLSRDFAAALVARESGRWAVSVDEAVCRVPRTGSLRREYRRKVRTMIRGMQTLWYKRHLLNPARQGRFAWMLFSHKVCRWLVPWAALVGLAGLVLLAFHSRLALVAVALVAAAGGLALAGWAWPEHRPMPRLIAIPAFALAGNVAALEAWVRALGGEMGAVWEPTRRDPVAAPGADRTP
jgi:cellulose synthase/poly-beta-1,6-N-acetylglucosamine synthase-like glycosyltransferase